MSDRPVEPAKPAPPPPGGAGRGALMLAAGNIYFIFAGIAIQFGLPSVLSRATFGAYTLVNSIVSLFNSVLITGTSQAVSKFTAQEPDKARRVQHVGLRMQGMIGVGIAIAFIAAAPVVSWFLVDASKTLPLMLAGLIIGGYAFYAVFVGTANGLHQFGKQTGLSVVFATIRAALMVGIAIAGFGVIGVIAGWVVAVAFILLLAIAWVGMPGTIAKADQLPVRPVVVFFVKVAVYLVLFNALLFVDTVLLKRLLGQHYAAHLAAMPPGLAWAPAATGYHPTPSVLADVQVGYYAAVQNLARVSYQVVLAGSFVAFPLVSRSTFTEDRDATRRYVGVITRYSMIAGAALAVVMAANPSDVLGVMYASDFVERGSGALPLLALGSVAFSLISIAGTVLNSAGKTRLASGLAAGTLVVAIVGNYLGISLAAGSGHVLEVAAAVTGGTMVLGAIAYGIVLKREFGAFVPLLSVARVAIATAAAMALGHVLPFHGKVMAIVQAGVVMVAFLVVLVITRELGRGDIAAIQAVRRKRA